MSSLEFLNAEGHCSFRVPGASDSEGGSQPPHSPLRALPNHAGTPPAVTATCYVPGAARSARSARLPDPGGEAQASPFTGESRKAQTRDVLGRGCTGRKWRSQDVNPVLVRKRQEKRAMICAILAGGLRVNSSGRRGALWMKGAMPPCSVSCRGVYTQPLQPGSTPHTNALPGTPRPGHERRSLWTGGSQA